MPAPDTDKSQKQRFIDKARELECDEDKQAFDEKLRRLAQPKREKPGQESNE